MTNIGHKAISASAGSGKTFQLAHRYIALLAHEVPSERICALTFSRKAASEIFDTVVLNLRRAAASPEEAAETAVRIGVPGFLREDALRLLRDLLHNMHRLHVGTLDSFIVSVVRAFPLELGIAADFDMLDNDGAAARMARREVLMDLFSQGRVDRKARTEFLEAFKQATFGQEEKALEQHLDAYIDDYHRYYLVLPEQEAWGQPDRIWPQGSFWLEPVGQPAQLAEACREELAGQGFSDRIMKRWTDFLERVKTFGPGSPWPREIDYLFNKLAPQVDELRKGRCELPIERASCVLEGEVCGKVLDVFRCIMRIELLSALERTRGIYRLLSPYETQYDEIVRRTGRITFDDAQYLLTTGNAYSGGALISRDRNRDARLYIDYRLDCRLDHWLLDEFQDTSDLQWDVLSNLADEILQDESGQRTFFYVGDIKQAIYGWRGGNARLFEKILDRYPDRIEQSPLNKSFRSSPPIIEVVNRMFSRLSGDLLPESVTKQWDATWNEHETEKTELTGEVALLEPDSRGGTDKPAAEDRYRVVADLLNDMDPLNRGLTVAILVRTNKNGYKVVDYLRSACKDLPIAHEGHTSINDNPVVAVLMSLARFAAHPGDNLAWRHLQMSPLRHCFEQEGLDRRRLPLRLLRDIQDRGFQSFVRDWGRRLDQVAPLDPYGWKRIEDLAGAAGAFDLTGRRDINRFLHFIETYHVEEMAGDNAVRVMTIHQSKGLGFDVVILPDLHGNSMLRARDTDFAVARDPGTHHPWWALHLPRRVVSEQDPVLAGQVRTLDEQACFDALCVLYVAITRAKRGLYLVTSFPGSSASSLNAAAFVKHRLCGDPKAVEGKSMCLDGNSFVQLFQAGDPNWWKSLDRDDSWKVKPEKSDRPLRDFIKRPSQRHRLTPVAPSHRVAGKESGRLIFTSVRRAGLDFGTAVHALFEKLEWADDQDPDTIVDRWRSESKIPGDLKDRVIAQFRKVVAVPEVLRALSRPPERCELWRERSFEVVLDRDWVSGTFDRVVVHYDAQGCVERATVLDYKSNEISSEEDIVRYTEHYRPQMELYRRALGHMLKIDEEQIRLQLLFTEPGVVRDLS